jgi:hypothetical protein
MASSGWLDRYRAGEHEQVWHELRQQGDRVRDGAMEHEAREVCDEMARRARHNVEVLVGRLREQGYVFHSNDDSREPVEPHRPPTAEADSLANWLESRFGPIPMALSSWVRIVGDVWLVGTHHAWPESSAADPLVLEVEGSRYSGVSMREHFESEFEAWQEWSNNGEDGRFEIPVAPDRLHKANISGGAPYGFPVPDRTAEGLFKADVAMPSVSYLNHVFHHGGFPATAPGDAQWRVKKTLAQGLLTL